VLILENIGVFVKHLIFYRFEVKISDMLLKTESQTIKAGKEFAATLHGGDIVLLYGELGAGKTTFVKGIAEFFGVKKKITSPTFALMNVYDVKPIKLVHVDTYRLKDEQELIDIGIEDYLGKPDAICVIEWPEKLSTIIKNKRCVKIHIEHTKNGRVIEFYNVKFPMSNVKSMTKSK